MIDLASRLASQYAVNYCELNSVRMPHEKAVLIINDSIMTYARAITGDTGFVSGEVFAKVLSPNDDNSRHGVLIPHASYGFFPDLSIPNLSQNARDEFTVTNAVTKRTEALSWIYYSRYPERRITRASPLLNERNHGRRLLVITRVKNASDESSYFTDVVVEGLHSRFSSLTELIFADSKLASPGAFVVLPLEASRFVIDEDLDQLLRLFDNVREMGWVDTLRAGDTGIGYTFETLVGIEENNHQEADFRGIEIKCMLRNGSAASSGKLNLFQSGPRWLIPGPNLQRLQLIGAFNEKGVLSCYSQVTRTPNNKGLWLAHSLEQPLLKILKNDLAIGEWDYASLSNRLREKHSRAVFIVAESRKNAGNVQYRYKDLLYCERPHIDRFVSLIDARRIVFEFTMHTDKSGKVRNHGYPWRLVDERDLEQLFAYQIQLRK